MTTDPEIIAATYALRNLPLGEPIATAWYGLMDTLVAAGCPTDRARLWASLVRKARTRETEKIWVPEGQDVRYKFVDGKLVPE